MAKSAYEKIRDAMAPEMFASAAENNRSSYQGVSTADLTVLYRALECSPATAAVIAILTRVEMELSGRNRDENRAAMIHPDHILNRRP